MPEINISKNPGGSFGYWFEDEYGLPAFDYTCDHEIEKAAAYFTTRGESRLHWHQIGNDRITAIASNRGEIQAIESSRGLQWLNYYNPKKNCPGGAIACIKEGDTCWTDLYESGDAGSGYRRIFGNGYFRKIKVRAGIRVSHTIAAPFGDDPVFISEIVITNESAAIRKVSVLEFFGINLHFLDMGLIYATADRRHFSPSKPENVAATIINSLISPVYDVEKRRAEFGGRFVFKASKKKDNLVILKPEYSGKDAPPPHRPSNFNYYPDPLFLAQIEGNADIRIINSESIYSSEHGFNFNDCKAAKSEKKLRRPCLCMGSEIELAAGEKKRLQFLFGYAAQDEAEILNGKYSAGISEGRNFFKESAEAWKSRAPVFSAPSLPVEENEWLSREAAWHSYYSRSAFLHDSYYDSHYAPQGGVYEYLQGLRGAVRDFALFATGIVYLSPGLAREILKFCFQMMTSNGRIMYLTHGYGKATGAVFHERPSDLQLFLFHALTEYVFFTGDYDFLHTIQPYFDEKGRRNSSTILEKTLVAFDYLLNEIGTGEHGLLRVGDGDWSDGISLFVKDRGRFVKRGESVFNSAMAIYVLPRLAGLLEKYDSSAARKARALAERQRAAVLKCWNGKWFFRAYDGAGRPMGNEHLFLEHHTWLLISRALPPDMAESVVNNVYKILDEPSSYGQYVLYPAAGTAFGQLAKGWDVNGGIWCAMNFLLTYGYACYDREKAWASLKKNSMANKASVYPNIWYGIWSGPDSLNAGYADRPGETFYHLPSPGTDFPVMNLNLHAGFISALVKLCGVEPTASGITVEPKLPFDSFSLEMPTFRLKVDGGKVDFKKL